MNKKEKIEFVKWLDDEIELLEIDIRSYHKTLEMENIPIVKVNRYKTLLKENTRKLICYQTQLKLLEECEDND